MSNIAAIYKDNLVKVIRVQNPGDLADQIRWFLYDGAREVVAFWEGRYYLCKLNGDNYTRTELAKSDERTLYIPLEGK